MRAGRVGAFVMSWSQTEIEGLRGAPVSALQQRATWRWNGRAIRLSRPGDVANLGPTLGEDAVRARTAMAVRRFVGRSLPPHRLENAASFEDPLMTRSFVVTDGRRSWTATLVEVAEVARPLLLFRHGLPPADTLLRVCRGPETEGRLNRITEVPTGVICFTRGTRLSTPGGERPVEDLVEGDLIDTKDAGPQEVVWIGRRRMSGARLYAMPELRPIRIHAGALGGRDPNADLIVSPRHKVLLRGGFARMLFNESEVLVAVEDIVNGRTIARDAALKSVDYIHLLLPRHHVVWANGVETESFHPASTNLATIDPAQRTRLETILPGVAQDPFHYGATARRELNRAEAALLVSETG